MKYLQKNWYVVLLIILAIVWSIRRSSSKPWHDWEIASIVTTIIYAAIVYIKLFRDNEIERKKLLLSVPALAVIGIAALMSGIEKLDVNGMTLFESSRTKTMGALFIGSCCFCAVDKLLGTPGSTTEQSFMKALKYSDVPVMLAFLVLWYYSWSIGSNPDVMAQMDPFFAGAIAFQMMLSNVVWSFTDDDIFEKR